MVIAQEWLDKKYPENGVCQRKSDSENNGRRRAEVTKLDISKERINKDRLFSSQILEGSLKLNGFVSLKTLVCTSHQITELFVDECSQLTEIYCKDNQISNLDVSKCLKLVKIEVDSQVKLTQFKPQIVKAEATSVRNLLIVGITGNGKSTLANVLSETDEFEVGESVLSKTQTFKKVCFNWKEVKYCVIDNVGFADNNNLTLPDLLYRIGEGVRAAEGKINQVLFVFRGKFTDDQIKNFNLFKSFISQSKIAEFTTIVRTGNDSLNFSNKNCDNEEWERLLSSFEKSSDDEKLQFGQMISWCNFIQVDNPPIPKLKNFGNKSENEYDVNIESLVVYNKKRRELSRRKLLDHLKDNCQNIYELEGWDSVYQMVVNYIEEIRKIENKQINNIEKIVELKEAEKQFADEMSVRLGVSAAIIETYVQVGFKNPRCCSVS